MKDVTALMQQAKQGDAEASAQLLPLVYEELRKLAAARMARESPGQTLQGTALVHEAYLRLVGFQPDACVTYTSYYITCDYTLPSGQIIENTRWWLGVKVTFLPGVGLGVEVVEAGSPAAEVGLEPGMVITTVNETPIIEEGMFPRVLAESGGVIDIVVQKSADGPSAEATIEMERVRS